MSDDWLATPTAANATGNFPFPQNRKSSNCTYPTTISNSILMGRYTTWKGRMTTSMGAPAGAVRVVDPVGPPANRTVSEGVGYGMLIAVSFADKTLFDQLWVYASAYLSNGLMSWQIDSTGARVGGDTHSATDADEDMAWALLMADKQWGGSYLATATTLIKAIKSQEVSGSTLESGDFTGGPTYYDYAAPAYYAGFAAASGDTSWNQVTTGEYSQLTGVQNGTTGLIPDNNGGSSFGYDAVRAPWRIGVDYCWHGTAQAQTFLGKLVPFLVNYSAQNGGPNSLKLPISLTGTMGTDTAGTINGPTAVGAMMTVGDQSFINASWTYLLNTIVPQTSSSSVIGPNYFSSTLGVLSLLMLSGNFIDYTNPPQ